MLQFTNYHTVAEGYGGRGLKLAEGCTKEIEETLSEAQELARDGNPVLVNVLIGRTNFREGSISV